MLIATEERLLFKKSDCFSTRSLETELFAFPSRLLCSSKVIEMLVKGPICHGLSNAVPSPLQLHRTVNQESQFVRSEWKNKKKKIAKGHHDPEMIKQHQHLIKLQEMVL